MLTPWITTKGIPVVESRLVDCPWNSLSRYMFCVVRNEHFLLPRTQTSLSLDENVRAKEGGKETSPPFPWFLAVHHQSLASTINRLEKRSAWGGGCIFCVLQILHLGAFKQPSLIGSGRFVLSDGGFCPPFGQIVSISVKELDNTNLVASRHFKRGRATLPVLTCVAQKRVSLSSVIRKRLSCLFSCYYNNGTNQRTVIRGPNYGLFSW